MSIPLPARFFMIRSIDAEGERLRLRLASAIALVEAPA
jgi:hypothetical protein